MDAARASMQEPSRMPIADRLDVTDANNLLLGDLLREFALLVHVDQGIEMPGWG